MIKRKGICDVCATEFELDEGTFGIRIMEDDVVPLLQEVDNYRFELR